MTAESTNKLAVRITNGCDCGCETPVATDAIGMLEFLAGRFEFAGVGGAVAETYAHHIRKLLASMANPRPASDLTETELADPAYMRAYVEGCNETTTMFAERARRLQEQLNGYLRPIAPSATGAQD
jgi:hypothetical protein